PPESGLSLSFIPLVAMLHCILAALDCFVNGQVVRDPLMPCLVFHDMVFQATVTYSAPMRNTNEPPVGKHGTRARITVIQNRLDALFNERGVQLAGSLTHGF